MDRQKILSEQVRVSKTGRVILDDEKLDALISSYEITAGGDGSVNNNCNNSGDCRGSMNTLNCTNSLACDGSLNAAGQCREVRTDQ